MCELKKYRDEATQAEIQQKVEEFQQTFDVLPTCEKEETLRAAKTSVALDKLVDAHKLRAMAYYYEGTDGNEYENIVTSVIAANTLLTGKNVPVAGECEVKNAQAMKIMDAFGAREFMNRWSKQGPAHHCAIGTGHIAEKIKKFAFLINMEVVQIC